MDENCPHCLALHAHAHGLDRPIEKVDRRRLPKPFRPQTANATYPLRVSQGYTRGRCWICEQRIVSGERYYDRRGAPAHEACANRYDATHYPGVAEMVAREAFQREFAERVARRLSERRDRALLVADIESITRDRRQL